MTIVEFYEGAYGPTVRIDAQEISAIESLIRAFELLSSRVGERIDAKLLHEFKFTHSIEELSLASVASPLRKKVLRTDQRKSLVRFQMLGTTDDWIDARDLILPLLEGKPSHQYLSSVPPDDAIVEIAILEPRPDWIENSYSTK